MMLMMMMLMMMLMLMMMMMMMMMMINHMGKLRAFCAHHCPSFACSSSAFPLETQVSNESAVCVFTLFAVNSNYQEICTRVANFDTTRWPDIHSLPRGPLFPDSARHVLFRINILHFIALQNLQCLSADKQNDRALQCQQGATENARPDIATPLKLRGLTSRDWTTRHHIARVDIARLVSVFEYRSSLQVYIVCSEYYMSCSSVLCL